MARTSPNCDFPALRIISSAPWQPLAPTATYCTPFTRYVIGGVQTPIPRLYCHSNLPFLASNASKLPSISPAKTRSLAVARAPPYIGRPALYCQAILPVATSIAENVPLGG